MKNKFFIGQVVSYKLTDKDAVEINRRRILNNSQTWVEGSQRHVGNNVSDGMSFPMIIVSSFGDLVNGQVFLDGNDVLWVKGISFGKHDGMCNFVK